MKLTKLIVAGLVLVGSAFLVGVAAATEVNCGSGDKISNALQKKGKTIIIRGTCGENVMITADDITLRGHPIDNGAIAGSVTIDGAQRTVIQDLDVTGPSTDGITVVNGASAVITNNSISGHVDVGLRIDNGSTVVATDNDITGGTNGIWVVRNSAAWLQGGNSVGGAYEETVFVNQSSSFRAGIGTSRDIFTNSTSSTDGITVLAVKEVSSMDIRNADITCSASCSDAVGISGGGTFRTKGDVRITGDVFVGAGSGVRLDGPTFLSGGLVCGFGSYGFGKLDCP
jgi:hypothetical protein